MLEIGIFLIYKETAHLIFGHGNFQGISIFAKFGEFSAGNTAQPLLVVGCQMPCVRCVCDLRVHAHLLARA